MSQIFAKEWIDIVFENKNKNYGAFEIRKQSDKRHMTAIIAGFSFLVLGVTAPGIIKSIIPEEKIENTIETSLADVKLDAPKEDQKVLEAPPPPPMRSTIAFVAPVATKEDVQEDMKSMDDLKDDKTDIGAADVKGDDNADRDLSDLDNQTQAIAAPVEEVFEAVEQEADFPGGLAKFYEFLEKNLVYPAVAAEMGISGTVYVQFTVWKDGSISNVQILRGVSKDLDNEAVRVIKQSPNWTPGRQNGHTVASKKRVPIKFVLKS